MARRYRGGATAKQRRRLNPGPLVRTGTVPGQEEAHQGRPFVGPSDQVDFHRAQQAKGQGRMIPKGMPIEHLVPPTLGYLPSNVRTWEKVPYPVEGWTSHVWPSPSSRQVFSAVPGPNWNIENGWVI